MKNQNWKHSIFFLGLNPYLTKTEPMSKLEDLYPDAQEFLETFSSVGDYNPDNAVYKYQFNFIDNSKLELYFSVNDLSTTIYINNPTGTRILSFYSEFVIYIRINKPDRSIFFSIDYGKNVNQTVLVRMENSATLEIISLKT